jgi:hypothetical protein
MHFYDQFQSKNFLENAAPPCFLEFLDAGNPTAYLFENAVMLFKRGGKSMRAMASVQ